MSLIRFTSIVSSVSWLAKRGRQFDRALARTRSGMLSARRVWALLEATGGGSTIFRPFGIQSVRLAYARKRALESDSAVRRNLTSRAIAATRMVWKFQVFAPVMSLVLILAAAIGADLGAMGQVSGIVIGLTLLGCVVALAVESIFAGNVDGWASYHSISRLADGKWTNLSPHHRFTRSVQQLVAVGVIAWIISGGLLLFAAMRTDLVTPTYGRDSLHELIWATPFTALTAMFESAFTTGTVLGRVLFLAIWLAGFAVVVLALGALWQPIHAKRLNPIRAASRPRFAKGNRIASTMSKGTHKRRRKRRDRRKRKA